MEKWFIFTAYNSQAHYGFGSSQEADAWVDILNRERTFNVYSARALEASETAALDAGDDSDGFNLSDALAAQKENDEWFEQTDIYD